MVGKRIFSKFPAIVLSGLMVCTVPIASAQDTVAEEDSVDILHEVEVQFQPISMDERINLGMDEFVRDQLITERVISDDSAVPEVPEVEKEEVVKALTSDTNVSESTSAAIEKARQAISDLDVREAARKEQEAKQVEAIRLQEQFAMTSGSTPNSSVNTGATIYNENAPDRVLPPVLGGQAEAKDNSSAGASSIPDRMKGSKAEEVVKNAMSKLGTPYVWGGTTPAGFDCSGFAQWSYAQASISIPRVTHQQVNAGKRVSLNDLQPGDLVFPADNSHVSIYIGNGNVVHSPQTGDVVKVTPLKYMAIATAVRII